MKKYTVETFVNGQWVTVAVPMPSPKDFQKTVDYGTEYRVLITNLSTKNHEQYAVALLEPETSEVLRELGFDFKTQANERDIYRIEGKGARETAINVVARVLAGGSLY